MATNQQLTEEQQAALLAYNAANAAAMEASAALCRAMGWPEVAKALEG